MGSFENKNDSKAAARKRSKKELFAPPVRTPIIVNKSSRGRFRMRVAMPENEVEGHVVDGGPPRACSKAGMGGSSSSSSDFVFILQHRHGLPALVLLFRSMS